MLFSKYGYDPDLQEDFGWMKQLEAEHKDRFDIETYFTLMNCDRTVIKKGE